MKPIIHILTALLLAPLAALPAADAPKPAAKPTIIYILADDFGLPNIGCQGSTFYRTPHIDMLPAEGVRFTEAPGTAAAAKR